MLRLVSDHEREKKAFEDFKRRLYGRTERDPVTGAERKVLGLKDSTGLSISRLRRCANCIHFDAGEKARKRLDHCISRDRSAFQKAGYPRKKVETYLRRLRATVVFPTYGVCLAADKRTDDNAAADFTHSSYRCEQYSGRIIVTPDEARRDIDVEEAYELAGLPEQNKGPEEN